MSLAQGRVVAIFSAPVSGADQQSFQRVELIAGQGLASDRYCSSEQDYPGQNLTLIEREEIERFNAEYQQNISLDATRRNVITEGIRLNDLVGRQFRIGELTVRGVELCEPCKTLGERLAGNGLSVAQVVKAFVHRGGLRVDVLASGEMAVGDGIVLIDT